MKLNDFKELERRRATPPPLKPSEDEEEWEEEDEEEELQTCLHLLRDCRKLLSDLTSGDLKEISMDRHTWRRTDNLLLDLETYLEDWTFEEDKKGSKPNCKYVCDECGTEITQMIQPRCDCGGEWVPIYADLGAIVSKILKERGEGDL